MFRFILLLCALAVAGLLIVMQGVRAIAASVILLLAVSVPRSRGWRAAEDRLVRLTGSRRRAFALVGVLILAAMVAAAAYSLIG